MGLETWTAEAQPGGEEEEQPGAEELALERKRQFEYCVHRRSKSARCWRRMSYPSEAAVRVTEYEQMSTGRMTPFASVHNSLMMFSETLLRLV